MTNHPRSPRHDLNDPFNCLCQPCIDASLRRMGMGDLVLARNKRLPGFRQSTKANTVATGVGGSEETETV